MNNENECNFEGFAARCGFNAKSNSFDECVCVFVNDKVPTMRVKYESLCYTSLEFRLKSIISGGDENPRILKLFINYAIL